MKESLYVYKSGTLSRRDNTLTITDNDGRKKDFPFERYDNIYLFGQVNVNSALLSFLSQKGINVHFFNYYGYYSGTFYSKEKNVSGELLIHQVEHYCDPVKRLVIAQKIIDSASHNICCNLKYYNSRGRDLQDCINQIEALRKNIYSTKSVSELMGYEGNIRKIYYSTWNVIINQEINFEKRIKHPPDNMINTLISFINQLVYTKTVNEIYITQLNPTISYLHEPGERRLSLSLDLSEIFKPLLADRFIFDLLNKKQITEKDFTKDLEYLHLKESASNLIVRKFDERMKITIHHKTLDKDVSYQYLIRLEAYKLIKHLMNEKEYDGFKKWW